MEKELNIAAILMDKPKGTKLFDQLHNIEVELDNIRTTNDVTTIWCKRELPNKTQHFGYSERGTERGWLDGLQILKPSKDMQDWSKFAWKKGDVLRYSDILVMFGGWVNGDYTQFKAAFECKYGSNLFVGGIIYYTSDFCKATDDVANNFIKKLENYYGGNLNLETLEIDKPQFKDGDIVAYGNSVAICQNFDGDKLCFYVADDDMLGLLYYSDVKSKENFRHATDSEKQQLFDAIAKEGKHWNSETKTLENLPKKCEFKPLDYILVRDTVMALPLWQLYQYTYENANFVYVVGSFYGLDKDRIDFIPYNDQTAHLLGTTDDWEGGD